MLKIHLTFKLICTIAILFFSNLSFAQLSQGEFLIGGKGDERGESVIQTTDGGYAIAGYTNSFGAGGYDIYVVKLDSNAKIEWTRTIGGIYDDNSYSIVQTQDGGFVVAGSTASFAGGAAYLIKLSISGNLLWTKTYTGIEYYGMTLTKDGGFAITGFGVFGFGSHSNIFVMKLDAAGNVQWTKIIHNKNNKNAEDQAFSIIQSKDGGYAITGVHENFVSAYLYVIKLDALGNLSWAKCIGDTSAFSYSYGWGNSIIQTTDKGYAITGSITLMGTLVYVVKLDSAGVLKWTKVIGGENFYTENQMGRSIGETSDHGLFIGGTTDEFTTNRALYLIKLDSIGNLKWTRVIGGGSDHQEAMGTTIKTKDNGFAIVGWDVWPYTDTNPGGPGDILFVKLDSSGGVCLFTNGGKEYNGPQDVLSNDTIANFISTIDSGGVIGSGGMETGTCLPVLFPPANVTLDSTHACSGCTGTASVHLNGDSLNNYSLLWSNGDTTAYAANLCSGRYTVKILYKGNIVYIDTVSIPSSSSPAVNIPSASTINVSCYNGNNGNATVVASGGTPPYNYSWYPSGGTGQTAINLTAGTYTVLTTDSDECGNIDTVTITQPSQLNITASPDTSIKIGNSAAISATANGGTPPYSYLWDGSIPGQDISVSPNSTTTYTVVVTDANGCTSVSYITVTILCGDLFIPDAFSPNGDGYNDYLYVRDDCIKTMDFIIYDRWGNKVFETTDQNIPWDGTYKGSQMNTGTYVYYLNATTYDGKTITKKGNVALVR